MRIIEYMGFLKYITFYKRKKTKNNKCVKSGGNNTPQRILHAFSVLEGPFWTIYQRVNNPSLFEWKFRTQLFRVTYNIQQSFLNPILFSLFNIVSSLSSFWMFKSADRSIDCMNTLLDTSLACCVCISSSDQKRENEDTAGIKMK